MATQKTKKVGRPKMAEKDRKQPEGRAIYRFGNAVNADGESIIQDGKLTAVPVTVETNGEVTFVGFDPFKHKPLKSTVFASSDVFMDFRAHLLNTRASKMTALADKLSARANRLRKFGNDETRKKAEKLERLRSQYKALEAELASEGVSVDDDE